MKNFRLFETEVEHSEAVIEECSVSYVIENDKLYTTPENNGGQNDTICTFTYKKDTYDPEYNTIKTINFDYGMDWEEFINSDYNKIDDDYQYFYYDEWDEIKFVHVWGTSSMLMLDGKNVRVSDTIVNGATYTAYLGGE